MLPDCLIFFAHLSHSIISIPIMSIGFLPSWLHAIVIFSLSIIGRKIILGYGMSKEGRLEGPKFGLAEL